MGTFIVKNKDIKRDWYVVDATDKVLGRLSGKIATTLMGKGKVIYSPHQDVGDFVVVTNASKIKVTGNKIAAKLYSSYSAYPGGLNQQTLEKMMKKNPGFVIRHAVKGMLPKSILGAALLKKLKVYAGAEHPHKAQKPALLKIA